MVRGVRLFVLCIFLFCIQLLTGCGSGKPPDIDPPGDKVSISPKGAGVVVATQKFTQTQQFSAKVVGDSDDSGFRWSVDAVAGGNATVGTISDSGLYTPPATAGSHVITATSLSDPNLSASSNLGVSDLPGIFTFHNDVARDGANTQEYALTGSEVNTNQFGKIFSCPIEGSSYTQPLWVPAFNISGGTHNVIFVATSRDIAYAFDADASPCVQYWKVNLLDTLHGGTAGERSVVWNDVGFCYGDVYPEIGVTGTPVIDPATNTMYLVSASEIVGSSSGNCAASSGTFYHRLHALDLATGSEKFNAPATITAAVPGTGDGSASGMLNFSSQLHHQRSALALTGGTVYVAFAAHEDATPYHGWLMGYAASNVQQQLSVFNTTPNGLNGADGGIWSSGGAPAIDSNGDLYVSTGNGDFDEAANSPGNDYGDSVLRLSPFIGDTSNGSNLNCVDWFTPDSEATLQQNDSDLGAGGIVLLPDQTGPVEHLLVSVGKEGVVYVLNRDDMGNFHNGNNNQIVQNFAGTAKGYWGTPAFWNNGLYLGGGWFGQTDTVRVFTFNPSSGKFATTPASQSSSIYYFPAVTPSISAQGTSNGIVWTVDASVYGHRSQFGDTPAPAILHAYSAADLTTEYWNSSMASAGRDQAGNAVKFVPPTIANGKVYLNTQSEIDVYGFLP
jgi:hypothetical protein